MLELCKQFFRISVWSAIIFIFIFLLLGFAAIGYNNRGVEYPSEDELSESLEESIVWLLENEQAMLAFDNFILWYFLHRSAQVSGDIRLQSLVESYYNKYVEPAYPTPRNMWGRAFKRENKFSSLPVSFEAINGLNYYSQYFAYGIYCDEELGRLDSIKDQNKPEFCGALHLFTPTCTTHQLMGIRFLQRSNCGDQTQLAVTVDALQSKVLHELTYDPRVLDVYIQRVMMLIESGSRHKIKNIWIRRILNQQNTDGGWGNFQPLVSLSDEKNLYFGLGHGNSRTGAPREGLRFLKIFGIGQPRSTFHATAQGTLLLTLLVHDN